MNKLNVLSVVAVFAAVMHLNAGQIEAIDTNVSSAQIEMNTGYSSDDVWRGTDSGKSETDVTVSTTASLPAETALTLNANYSNAERELKDDEVDLSAVFSKEVADYLLSLSYTWYSQDRNESGRGQAQEAGLTVSREVGPVDVSLTQYMSVVGDNNNYTELAATYSNDFGTPLVFDFRSELGYLAQEGKATHFETRVSTDLPFTKEIIAVPFVAYSLGLDDSVGIHSDMSNLFFGGIEFKRSF